MILYILYVTDCYTNGCLCSNVTPEDGHDERPKHVEFLEIKANTHTVASCWMYLYISFKYVYYYHNNNILLHVTPRFSRISKQSQSLHGNR
jgi:hypothetical protein